MFREFRSRSASTLRSRSLLLLSRTFAILSWLSINENSLPFNWLHARSILVVLNVRRCGIRNTLRVERYVGAIPVSPLQNRF